MNYSDLFLYFSVGTLAVLIIVLLSLIRKIDKQFKEVKGLQLDDIHLEDKINEEIESLQVEQKNIQQELVRRVGDLENKIGGVNIEDEFFEVNKRIDRLLTEKDGVNIESEDNGLVTGINASGLSDRIMSIIGMQDSVVSDDLADALDVSEEEVKEQLDKLEGAGRIEQIGKSGSLIEYRIRQ
ncbi:hypothetical protein ACFL08_03775 [Patescibacteria group bacterium]